MDWLERHLAVFPDPELLLVIGAGQGRDLPLLTRYEHARIVLLEPQPPWAESLRRQTAGLPGVEVLECALDDESGLATLKVFNFPELSSLRPSEDLTSLLPGARQISEIQVKTCSLVDLAQTLELQPGPGNWLIVDAPGMESEVLKGLRETATRGLFGHVVLRTDRRQPGTDTAGAGQVEQAFGRRGYRLLGDVDSSDGDWPRQHLQFEGNTSTSAQLEAEVNTLQQQARTLQAEKEALQQQKEDLQHRMLKIKSQRHQDAPVSPSQVAMLTEELTEAKQSLKKLAFEYSSAAEFHDRQREQMEADLKTARDDLAIALRLQALRDADLKELKTRYAEINEVKEQQHELLVQLGQRLKAASEYLNALKGAGDAPGTSVLTDSLSRMLSGELESSP